MRGWKIRLNFDNGMTNLSTCTLSSITAFIKKAKIKNNNIKPHSILPVEAWVIDMALDHATRVCPGGVLINATLQEFYNE